MFPLGDGSSRPSLLPRYDILVGRSSSLGNATRASFQSHVSLMKALRPGEWSSASPERSGCSGFKRSAVLYHAVVACGYISAPTNGKKVGSLYLQGAKLQFFCNDGYLLQGSQARVCQENGQWSGETVRCEVPSTGKWWKRSSCFALHKSTKTHLQTPLIVHLLYLIYQICENVLNKVIPKVSDCTITLFLSIYWTIWCSVKLEHWTFLTTFCFWRFSAH